MCRRRARRLRKVVREHPAHFVTVSWIKNSASLLITVVHSAIVSTITSRANLLKNLPTADELAKGTQQVAETVCQITNQGL